MAENEFPVPADNRGNAALPAVNNASTAVAEVGSSGGSSSTDTSDSTTEDTAGIKRPFFEVFKDFLSQGDTKNRLIIFGFLVLFVGAIIFGMITFHGSSSSEPESERLLGRYKPQEMGQVIDFLDNQGFKYRVGGGNSIFVEVNEYSSITEKMLRNGVALPQERTDEGDGILMTDSGFGVSQRLENERIKHSREQQLARAIEKIDGVDHATVLLAVPRENVFARQQNKPSAAVVVTLKQNSWLSPENVNSIRLMVASSVHNLMAKDVSVTDQQGRLLSAEVKTDTAENKLQREFELRTMREAQYRDKLDSILMPMLGAGNYSAEVDVTLDTTVQEETSQLYNPDNQAVRSETLREQTGAQDRTGPYGVPGSLSNQPPANAAIPQQLRDGTGGAGSADASDSRRESREAVRNYEVDTTVRHTVRPSNQVQRLTVSVAVDYTRSVNEEGWVVYNPRSQEDLNKIADLVRGGLGLDERRGDFVKVETVEFPHADQLPPSPWYQQDFFFRIIRVGGSVLIILIAIIFIIRPMLNKLLHKEESELAELENQDDLDSASALEGNDELNLIARSSDMADQIYSINEEGGIDLPNLHQPADLLKAVRTLVSNEPMLTAEVIKEWLEEEQQEQTKEGS